MKGGLKETTLQAKLARIKKTDIRVVKRFIKGEQFRKSSSPVAFSRWFSGALVAGVLSCRAHVSVGFFRILLGTGFVPLLPNQRVWRLCGPEWVCSPWRQGCGLFSATFSSLLLFYKNNTGVLWLLADKSVDFKIALSLGRFLWIRLLSGGVPRQLGFQTSIRKLGFFKGSQSFVLPWPAREAAAAPPLAGSWRKGHPIPSLCLFYIPSNAQACFSTSSS